MPSDNALSCPDYWSHTRAAWVGDIWQNTHAKLGYVFETHVNHYRKIFGFACIVMEEFLWPRLRKPATLVLYFSVLMVWFFCLVLNFASKLD